MAALNQIYTYPGPKELRDVERLKLPRLVSNSPLLRFFPFEGKRSFYLEWEQKDDYGGMTQIRSLNGEPPRVNAVGRRRFLMRPGVYGEFMQVDEMEMTLRTANGSMDQPIDARDLVAERQDQLLVRRVNRIDWLLWQLCLYGHFNVTDVGGVIVHTDAYAIQRYVAPAVYSDTANARPIYDFGQVALYGRGAGVNFGRGATAFVNRVTGNRISMNTNQADIGGKKVNGGNSVSTLSDVNRIFLDNDLPTIEVYDETYLDENANAVPFIPDNKAVVMGGINNGETIGNFRYVFNAVNPGGEPAPYTKVLDKTENQIPPVLEVHDGFNGGPVIYYPSAIVTMDI